MRRLVLLFLSSPLLAAPPVYLRAGAGLERSRETVLRDRDCGSTQPPALFGCGFDARGDFGQGSAFELAIGAGTRTRVELALAHRALELDATSNFTGVPGEQHVRSEGRSISAMLSGAVDLAPRAWRLRPFITAGAGVARNSTGAIVYSFPGIAPEAVTITRGGTHTELAWSAGGGAAFTLTDALAVELTFRHADLGTLRSPRGTATIVRPNRTLELEIGETGAEIETRGIMLSLRWTR
jgi:opacity protein-like surface antigen